MKVSGIIAEYNPFHKGHLYHLQTSKETTGSSHTIVVMSGNYTQRGLPAILDKYTRARQALLNGADLVLELPTLFATAFAEGFSLGAVSLLHGLGVVDYLVFGSEGGKTAPLVDLASFLNDEPPSYQLILQDYMKKGASYPRARALSLQQFFPQMDNSLLTGSNNILGLEYCRALLRLQSSILPVAIKRLHNQYRDTALAGKGKFSSATAIRNSLQNMDDKDFSALREYLPDTFFSLVSGEDYGFYPVFFNDFSLMMQYKLLMESGDSLASYEDVSRELALRIIHKRNDFRDMESFCSLLKTREITHSRISRALLHILLDIKKEDVSCYKAVGYCPYARILGFRRASSPLLHEIKRKASIPVISKLADASAHLSAADFSLLEKEIRAAHIYEAAAAQKYRIKFINEFTRSPILV